MVYQSQKQKKIAAAASDSNAVFDVTNNGKKILNENNHAQTQIQIVHQLIVSLLLFLVLLSHSR